MEATIKKDYKHTSIVQSLNSRKCMDKDDLKIWVLFMLIRNAYDDHYFLELNLVKLILLFYFPINRKVIYKNCIPFHDEFTYTFGRYTMFRLWLNLNFEWFIDMDTAVEDASQIEMGTNPILLAWTDLRCVKKKTVCEGHILQCQNSVHYLALMYVTTSKINT